MDAYREAAVRLALLHEASSSSPDLLSDWATEHAPRLFNPKGKLLETCTVVDGRIQRDGIADWIFGACGLEMWCLSYGTFPQRMQVVDVSYRRETVGRRSPRLRSEAGNERRAWRAEPSC